MTNTKHFNKILLNENAKINVINYRYAIAHDITLIDNDLSISSHVEWSSNWVEPELGRSTLGLSRVEHSASARRVEPDKHFWPSGLAGFEFLFDGLNRTQRFVRRVESNRHICSSSTQPEFRPIQKSRVGRPTLGLDQEFCSTGWIEQTTLFDELTWVITLCPSPSPGLARVLWS
jgi:hypothetical protein